MIHYNYETEFKLANADEITDWIKATIANENHKLEEISYIFCDDEYLVEKNVKYLNHNTLTDIISFDYSVGKIISGDIFISIERVKENATIFKVSLEQELHRVIIHGILHYCGYHDKTDDEKKEMRSKENCYLSKLKNKK